MKLYYSPGTCSLSPHIVAREADVAIELVRVDLRTKRVSDERNFLDVNPRGYVPALELGDGQVLREGAVIVQYLADRVPERGLLPALGSFARVRVQEWLHFIATELHKPFHWLFHPAPEETRRAERQRIVRRIEELDVSLAACPYLAGEQFGVADAYAFTVLRWCKPSAISLASYERVCAYMERIAARPHVREALSAEGLV